MKGKIKVIVEAEIEVDSEHYECDTLEEVCTQIQADVEEGNYGIDEVLESSDDVDFKAVLVDG